MQDRSKSKPLPPVKITAKKSRLIGRAEIMYRIPVTWPTLERRMREGAFPLYRKFGDKLVWLESDIEDFIAGTWSAPRQKAEA